MLFRTSVGIELAGNDLRVAVVRQTTRSFRLAHTFVVPDFVGMTDEEKARQLKELVSRHHLSSSRVHFSLPRDKGIARQIEFPVEIRERLHSAIALQIESFTAWPLNEVYWDYSHSINKKNAKALVATVAIIPKETLDPWITLFKSVGLALSGASLSSVACAHGVSVLWDESRPSVVIGCEPNYVESSLVHEDRLNSTTLTGTDTPALSHSAAERVLSLGRIANPEAIRVIAHGATASLIEVEPIKLPMDDAKSDSSRHFGVIAAALGAFKRTAFGLNLVPPAMRFHQNQLQLIPTYVLLALTLLLGIAMLLRGPYQMSVYASRIDTEISEIAPMVREVSAQEAELNRLSEKYRALVGHLQNRDQNLESLVELSKILPQDVWLTSYSLQNGTIAVAGYATSASTVQEAIEGSTLFKDAQFANSVTREASGKDRFSLKAVIEVVK
jgi:Tfp pilus assembly protein PilN